MNIAPPSLEGVQAVQPVSPKLPEHDKFDFSDALGNAISEARTRESTATQSAERFAQGDPSMGIHEVVIASEKANIALRYATTLKNKAIDAYRELMNTQV